MSYLSVPHVISNYANVFDIYTHANLILLVSEIISTKDQTRLLGIPAYCKYFFFP